MKSKKYSVLGEWDDHYKEEGYISSIEQLCEFIVADPEVANIEEIVIGFFGECYEVNSRPIIDMFVNNTEKFKHIKSFFMSDVEQEDCEISWINQCDYSGLLEALPNLEKLTIKGTDGLVLGDMKHEKLKALEIISGGTPVEVIESIGNAEFPALEKLVIFVGVDAYGFEGGIEDIENLMEKLKGFKSLKYLGIVNSEIQNELTEAVIKSGIAENLEVLDFSYGTLTDVGANHILNNIDKLKHLKGLELNHCYLSKTMVEKLEATGIKLGLEDLTVVDISDEFINNYYRNTRSSYDKRFYEEVLEENNIEKIEIDKILTYKDGEEVLREIMCDVFYVYPLYTE